MMTRFAEEATRSMAKEMLRAIQDFPTWSQQQHSSEYIAYTGDGKSKATAQLGLDFVDDYNEKQKLPRFKKKNSFIPFMRSPVLIWHG